MNRSYRLFAVSCIPLALAAGCAQVSAVRNPETPACVASLRQAFGDILVAQGEAPQAVAQLVQQGADPVLLRQNGPRPLFLRSPSGIDYGLFFDRRDSACLLRLYMRRQGFSTYTNNITYIDTRAVGGCDCGPRGFEPIATSAAPYSRCLGSLTLPVLIWFSREKRVSAWSRP